MYDARSGLNIGKISKMSNFNDIFGSAPDDKLVIQRCEAGGYEATFGSRYLWLSQAHNPEQACQQALAAFTQTLDQAGPGLKPVDLIKSMPEGPMKKTMLSYARSVFQQHKQGVQEIEEHKLEAKEIPTQNVTKWDAIEYLMNKAERIRHEEDERLEKANKFKSLSGMINSEIKDISWLVGRLEVMHDADFKAWEGYPRLVDEITKWRESR